MSSSAVPAPSRGWGLERAVPGVRYGDRRALRAGLRGSHARPPRSRRHTRFISVITFADVTVGYRGVPVREHVSFEVRRGDFLGIAGANGAGKTTILRTLLGL